MKTREVLSLGTRRFRGRGHISALAGSPDGRFLAASSSMHDEMVVFERASGEAVLRDREGGNHLFFSSDGKVLISAFARVHAWAMEGGSRREDDRFEGLRMPIALAPTGRFAGACGELEVRTFSLQSPGQTQKVHASSSPIRNLALSDDGTSLAVATGNSPVQLVDVLTATSRSLSHRTATHHAVSFRPGSRSFVTGGRGSTLFFESSESAGRELPSGNDAEAFAFTPDGMRLAVSQRSGDVAMIDVRSGGLLWRHAGTLSDPALAFVDGGDTLAVAAQSKVVFLDTVSGVPREGDDDPFDQIAGVVVSPNGDRAVTTSFDRSVDLWDLRIGARVSRLGQHELYAHCAAFSPDALWVVSGGSDGTLRFWSAEPTAATPSLPAVIELGWSDVTSVAWSPDGATIAAIQEDGAIHLVDASTRATRLLCAAPEGIPLRGRPTGRFAVAFAAKDMLVASRPDEVIVIDARTGLVTARSPATRAELAFWQHGARIAIVDEREMRILALPDLAVLERREVGVVGALAFGSHGELAVATWNDGVDFYESGSNVSRRVLEPERGHATSLALLHDGRLLIGTSHGETLLVETGPSSPVPDSVAPARQHEVRAVGLVELLDGFRTRAIPGGYRGPAPEGKGAGRLEIMVPVAGGTACVRAESPGDEIHLSISVTPGSATPPDLVPRDPISRARRWIKDHLSADAQRSKQEDTAFLSTLPTTPGFVRARLLRASPSLALVVVTTAVPDAAWLETVVSAVVTAALPEG